MGFLSIGCKELTGYLPHQLIKSKTNSYYKLIHPEDRAIVNNERKKAIKSHSQYQVIYRIKTKNNAYKWVLDKGKPIFLNSDKGVTIDGVILDITNNRNAEIELIREKDFTENLIETANTIIVTLDSNANIIIFNKYAEKLTGYKKTEIIGKNWYQILSPNKNNKYIPKLFKESLNKIPEISTHESFIKTKNGDLKLISWSNSVIKDKFNNVTGILNIGLDITSRKLIEDQLSATHKRLKLILDGLDSLVYIADIKTYEILFINHYGKNIWGNIVGKKCYETIQNNSNGPCSFCRRDEVIKNRKRNFINKYELRNSTNSRFYECRDQIIEWTNGKKVFMQISTDITERKKTQDFMIQTEKMITVGGLAAGMAHEINNPLGVIVQGIQMIQHRFDPQNTKNKHLASEYNIDLNNLNSYMEKREITQYIEGMRTASTRAAKIVSNMVQFSRIADSHMNMYSLNKIIDNTIEMAAKDYNFIKKYDFRSINIIKNYYKHLPKIACANNEIEQVLLNLLNNAAFAITNKKNSAKKPQIVITTMKTNKKLIVQIEDNGPGISSDVKKHIFEPFYTTKGVGMGTGLGLSVSYFIIKNNYHGDILVESEPGKGAKFIIKLPLVSER
jgi:PAS domain S-box-containing protein